MFDAAALSDDRLGETARPAGQPAVADQVVSRPHATTVADPQASPLQRELLAKMEMEAALVAAPHDGGLRAAYFDLLLQFARSRTGLAHALLPEIGHPLYFRCGSSDVANLVQVFRDGAMNFALRATPLCILDLGAYVGYAAVALARRFPQAQIACVEPSAASFRLLTLNTLPYRRIRPFNVAVWHSATRLAVTARYHGDWGTQLHDHGREADRTVPAQSVADLLRLLGWNEVHLIKCDIEGSEQRVFADPGAAWLRAVDAVAIEIHDSIVKGSGDTVGACFDPALFERARHGEAELFLRRTPYRAVPKPPPRELPLINSEPGLFPLALQDVVAAPWGFFTFDGNCCQLHPNFPGEAPARAIFPRTLDGHCRFSATLHHAGEAAAPLVFTLIVQAEDGQEILRSQRTLAAQERALLAEPLPSLTGRHRIVLQTEMAADAPHNFNAWARWIDARVA